MTNKKKKSVTKIGASAGYDSVLSGVAELLEAARRTTARVTNAVMTATYWEIGRRIVEYEQEGQSRAEYGKKLLKRLAVDLTQLFGRGFSERNLEQMRLFYSNWPISQTLSAKSDGVHHSEKSQTLSGELSASISSPIIQTVSEQFTLKDIANRFPLPWSHYVRILLVKNPEARTFYEKEALRGGWSVRQLDRQINSQFYERTALSRNKAARKMLERRPEKKK